tara:strand:- start:11 stop:871 length:861 start_codon:yes stop_codon:yes gene_type:complete
VVKTIPAALSLEHGRPLLESLMNGKLLSSGPKFISESAKQLIKDTASRMDPIVAVKSLKAVATSTKHPLVEELAFSQIGGAVMRLEVDRVVDAWNRESTSSSSSSGGKLSRSDIGELVVIASVGVRAKMPGARDLSRRALSSLHDALGETVFKALCQTRLSEMQVVEIQREIQKKADDAMRSSGGASLLRERERQGEGLSQTVPYRKDSHRLESDGGVGGSSSSSSSGKLSLREQMEMNRLAMRQEKRRPQTASEAAPRGGNNSSSNSNNGKKEADAGAIFIFHDM